MSDEQMSTILYIVISAAVAFSSYLLISGKDPFSRGRISPSYRVRTLGSFSLALAAMLIRLSSDFVESASARFVLQIISVTFIVAGLILTFQARRISRWFTLRE